MNENYHERFYVAKKLGKVSKDFNYHELICKCNHEQCCEFLVNPLIIYNVQALRDHYSLPLYVKSSIRCYTHNKNVGGASDSQHLVLKNKPCNAIDLYNDTSEYMDRRNYYGNDENNSLFFKETYCKNIIHNLISFAVQNLDVSIGFYPMANTPFIHIDCRNSKKIAWIHGGQKPIYFVKDEHFIKDCLDFINKYIPESIT